MGRKRMIIKPGKRWRILAHKKRGSERVELANEGTFDELVIDSWFHLEQMGKRCWWARIGDAYVWIRITKKGKAKVTIRRGEYDDEAFDTAEAKAKRAANRARVGLPPEESD